MSGAADMSALSRVEPERMVLSSMAMVLCTVLLVGIWVMGAFEALVMEDEGGNAKGFLSG